MTVEQALTKAIEYENKVRDHYAHAAELATEETGRSLFSLMACEEQHHIEFLEHTLRAWKERGAASPEGLRTALPSPRALEAALSEVPSFAAASRGGAELDFLTSAHDWEVRTSDFYRKMAAELPPEARALFTRFVEIEDGHLALVQAQIDRLTGTGYWFDVREFDLEG